MCPDSAQSKMNLSVNVISLSDHNVESNSENCSP